MSVARTKKERFLPWAWEKFGFRFEVVAATLDGNRPGGIDPERHLVDLDEGWDRATLELRIEAQPELFSRVLAPKDAGRIVAVVALRCDRTRLRLGERIVLPRAPGVITHQVQLRRTDLAGVAELTAVLVREANAAMRMPGFAATAGARLADSRPWELRIDRRRTLTGIYLDVRYRDFTSDESIPKRERDNLHRLDTSEHPILWLNSHHSTISGILNAKGHVGKRAVLRDVAYDLIVPAVWLRLFVNAAEQLRRGEEVAYSWQDAVLDAAARLLYPERKDSDDARSRLEVELEDLSSVLNRLDSALQEGHDVAKHLVRLAEELE